MGIEIILYDSSPVTQKIFFHILYHYRPIVHRIDQTSKLMEKIQYSNPDIIFIDAHFSDEIKNQINHEKQKLKNIPIILMAKKDPNQKDLESSVAQDFLKKPIEARKLRELINRFIPKTKSNILTEHLKFPPTPDFKEKKNQINQDSISPFSSKSTIKEFEEKKEELHTASDKPQPPDPNTDGIEKINPVAITEEVSNKQKEPPIDSLNQESYQSADTGIKPIIGDDQFTDEQNDLPTGPSYQKNHPSMDAEDINASEEKKSATDVKILQVPDPEPDSHSKIKTHTPDDLHSNTQLKNQINDYIKQLTQEPVNKEIAEQIKHYAEKNSQEIIKKTAEKVVWQVVPELARQLITKELDKLLKEEETEKQEQEDPNNE